MNFTTNRDIIDEAVNMGCKTISQLALYIKLRGKIGCGKNKKCLHPNIALDARGRYRGHIG